MLTLNAQFGRRLFIASAVMLVLSLILSMANVAAVISAPLRANSSVPNTVGFEGFLAQANGAPIANGTYTLTFRAYDVPTAGTALWAEQLTHVQVTNGLYSVVLGATMPFNANTFNGSRWIGVTVGTGTEIVPRTQISAVPFALNAETANRIGGGGTANMVAMFDGPCPDGWTEYTAALGRVVVGVPANGTLGGTVGTALADKENRTHSHPHKHITPLSEGTTTSGPNAKSAGIRDVNGFTNWTGSNHWYAVLADLSVNEAYWYGDTRDYYTGDAVGTGQGGATADVIPYIQLRYCKLNQ
jgi:hypothetical protein